MLSSRDTWQNAMCKIISFFNQWEKYRDMHREWGAGTCMRNVTAVLLRTENTVGKDAQITLVPTLYII